MAQHAHKGTCGVHKRRTSQGEKSILTHNFYSQSCCLDKPAVWLHGSFDADVEVTPLQSTAPPAACAVLSFHSLSGSALVPPSLCLLSRECLIWFASVALSARVIISAPTLPCVTAMALKRFAFRVRARVSLQVGPQRFSDPTCN